MKKVIAILLCVISITTMFYGCKKEDTQDANTIDGSVQELKYNFDAYYLKEDDSVKRNYADVCKAIINREETFKLNINLFQQTLSLIMSSFPLASLVDQFSMMEDNSGFKIIYKYEPKVHEQMVDSFTSKINSIMTDCKYGQVTNKEYLVNLYQYIATNSKKSDDPSIDVYNTIISDEGTEFSYAKMYSYLLQQADFETYQILAYDEDANTCSLVLVNMDGKYYYFAPFAEGQDTAGMGLKYFGLTTKNLTDIGYNSIEYSSFEPVEIIADDEKFAECQNAVSYSLENGVLTIKDSESKTTQITL